MRWDVLWFGLSMVASLVLVLYDGRCGCGLWCLQLMWWWGGGGGCGGVGGGGGVVFFFFFFQAEDGIRDIGVTGVQTCALPILSRALRAMTESRSLGPELQIER